MPAPLSPAEHLAAEATKRGDDAWRKLDLERCRVPNEPSECDKLKAYVRMFPKSAHNPEARQILNQSSPAIEAMVAAKERAKRIEVVEPTIANVDVAFFRGAIGEGRVGPRGATTRGVRLPATRG